MDVVFHIGEGAAKACNGSIEIHKQLDKTGIAILFRNISYPPFLFNMKKRTKTFILPLFLFHYLFF